MSGVLLSCFHIGCDAHLEQLHQYLAHYILDEIRYINVGLGQKLFFRANKFIKVPLVTCKD